MNHSDSVMPSDLPSEPGIGLGVDIVEIARIERLIRDWGSRFTRRLFTDSEQENCAGNIASLAGRFAAKEAFVKAIGTGLRGMAWRDIEILNHHNGRPYLVLHRGAKAEFTREGWKSCSVSLSHAGGMAVAIVAAIQNKGTPG